MRYESKARKQARAYVDHQQVRIDDLEREIQQWRGIVRFLVAFLNPDAKQVIDAANEAVQGNMKMITRLVEPGRITEKPAGSKIR